MAKYTAALFFLLAAPGLAANPTTSIFWDTIVDFPTSTLIPVSVVGAEAPSKTTFAVGCSALGDAAEDICSAGISSLTFTAGPSLLEAEVQLSTMSASGNVHQSCAITGSSLAVCTGVATIDGFGTTVTTTTSTSYSGSPTLAYRSIEVTAGADKIKSNSASTKSIGLWITAVVGTVVGIAIQM